MNRVKILLRYLNLNEKSQLTRGGSLQPQNTMFWGPITYTIFFEQVLSLSKKNTSTPRITEIPFSPGSETAERGGTVRYGGVRDEGGAGDLLRHRGRRGRLLRGLDAEGGHHQHEDLRQGNVQTTLLSSTLVSSKVSKYFYV